MSVPAMHYIGCGFDWFFVLLCIGGYFYTLTKAGNKWTFWLIFAAAWTVFGISYSLMINGIPAGEWYITLLRITGYVLFTVAIFSLIAKIRKSEQ